MTILGKNILHQHGPYVEFAVLEVPPPTQEWLAREKYEKGIFFELSDSLLDCYCGITQSYSPFDPHDLTCLTKPHQIYEFTAKLLMWEFQIARTPNFYFHKAMERYYMTELQSEAGIDTPEKFKAALLETLHFVIGHLHQAAASGECVVIVGF